MAIPDVCSKVARVADHAPEASHARPKYVLILPESDHNGCFSSPVFTSFIRKIESIAELNIVSVGSIDALNKAFQDYRDAQVVLIGGHGKRTRIQLSETSSISAATSLSIDFKVLACRHICILSCGVGSGGNGSIAQLIAMLSGKVVLAAHTVFYPYHIMVRPSYRSVLENLPFCFEGDMGYIFSPDGTFRPDTPRLQAEHIRSVLIESSGEERSGYIRELISKYSYAALCEALEGFENIEGLCSLVIVLWQTIDRRDEAAAIQKDRIPSRESSAEALIAHMILDYERTHWELTDEIREEFYTVLKGAIESNPALRKLILGVLRDSELKELIRFFIQSGNLTEAKNIAKYVYDSFNLREICLLFIAKDYVEDAMELAENLFDVDQLFELAATLYVTGDIRNAHTVCSKLSTDSLIELASRFVNQGKHALVFDIVTTYFSEEQEKHFETLFSKISSLPEYQATFLQMLFHKKQGAFAQRLIDTLSEENRAYIEIRIALDEGKLESLEPYISKINDDELKYAIARIMISKSYPDGVKPIHDICLLTKTMKDEIKIGQVLSLFLDGGMEEEEIKALIEKYGFPMERYLQVREAHILESTVTKLLKEKKFDDVVSLVEKEITTPGSLSDFFEIAKAEIWDGIFHSVSDKKTCLQLYLKAMPKIEYFYLFSEFYETETYEAATDFLSFLSEHFSDVEGYVFDEMEIDEEKPPERIDYESMMIYVKKYFTEFKKTRIDVLEEIYNALCPILAELPEDIRKVYAREEGQSFIDYLFETPEHFALIYGLS